MNIQLGDTVSYTKEGTVEIYGKVKDIASYDESYVKIDDSFFYVNTNLVQKEVA